MLCPIRSTNAMLELGRSIRACAACPQLVSPASWSTVRPRCPVVSSHGQRTLFTCTTMSMPTETPRAQMVSIRSLLYHAIQAAERGGSEVRAVASAGGDMGVRSKSLCYNPVTLGDMRSHLAMKGTLKRAFPFVTVISEEDDHCLNSVAVELDSEANRVTGSCSPTNFQHLVSGDEIVSVHDVTVWIDPLDGTQEYTEGQYQYVTTMVGIAVKGKPVAGVIHMPFPDNETYWAWLGHGLCPSLQYLEGAGGSSDSSALRLGMSKNPCRAGTIRRFAQRAFPDQPFELVPMGGAGYKFVQLLLGNVDAYLHVTRNIKKWDVCAGHGIVRAMHGCVTGLHGEEVSYLEPENGKKDVAIQTGFIGAVRNHENLLNSCRRAG